MLRTYKYLLRPTTEQSQKLDYLLWQSRLVYNAALEQRIGTYHATGKGIGYGTQWAHFRDVRRVLVTHGHPDHTFGFPSLLQCGTLYGITLTVYGSKQTLAVLRKLAAAYGLDDPAKHAPTRWRQLTAGKRSLDRPPFSVSSFRVSHIAGSLGYRFTFRKSGTSVAFSGDTAYSETMIEACRGCDILVHDCFCPERVFRRYPRLYSLHTSSLQLGRLASECKAKTLVPVHFASEVSYCFREIIDEIKKNYRGTLVIPKDGQRLLL
jgi:ribonuclease BN (tRNA processing enzyme)